MTYGPIGIQTTGHERYDRPRDHALEQYARSEGLHVEQLYHDARVQQPSRNLGELINTFNTYISNLGIGTRRLPTRIDRALYSINPFVRGEEDIGQEGQLVPVGVSASPAIHGPRDVYDLNIYNASGRTGTRGREPRLRGPKQPGGRSDRGKQSRNGNKGPRKKRRPHEQ
ncbi:hypothetical protein JW930_03460 [Candidatus Woesearchaeota archaeon]|nr:hypothetical protein [Candidatus Woesearchaeota archaeon]